MALRFLSNTIGGGRTTSSSLMSRQTLPTVFTRSISSTSTTTSLNNHFEPILFPIKSSSTSTSPSITSEPRFDARLLNVPLPFLPFNSAPKQVIPSSSSPSSISSSTSSLAGEEIRLRLPLNFPLPFPSSMINENQKIIIEMPVEESNFLEINNSIIPQEYILPTATEVDGGMQAVKRTWQPSKIKRKRTHGFLERMRTHNGRLILKNRIAKGRARIAV